MPKNRTPRIILALVLFFLILLPLFTNGVNLLVDWLWFKQEGFRVIFRTILVTQIQLSGLVGVGFMIVTALNLLIAAGSPTGMAIGSTVRSSSFRRSTASV